MNPTTFYALAGAAYGFLTSRAKTKRVQNAVKFGVIGAAGVALATKGGLRLPVPGRFA